MTKEINAYYDATLTPVPGSHSAPVASTTFHIDNCPLCHSEFTYQNLRDYFDLNDYDKEQDAIDRRMIQFKLSLCRTCGWWQITQVVKDYEYSDWGFSNFVQSVFKEFEVDRKDVPTDVLAQHLLKKGDQIYHIHSRKMEELVAAVFKEHFDCEVIHCGRTGDKGIDLLLVLKDNEVIPVQIKRRMNPGKTEPVRTVREMFGVMYQHQFRSAMIVSTADKFSPDCINDVKSVIADGLADYIKLFNLNNFMSIMKQYYKGQECSILAEAGKLVKAQAIKMLL